MGAVMKQVEIDAGKLLGYRLMIGDKTAQKEKRVALSRDAFPVVAGARIGGKTCQADKTVRPRS